MRKLNYCGKNSLLICQICLNFLTGLVKDTKGIFLYCVILNLSYNGCFIYSLYVNCVASCVAGEVG